MLAGMPDLAPSSSKPRWVRPALTCLPRLSRLALLSLVACGSGSGASGPPATTDATLSDQGTDQGTDQGVADADDANLRDAGDAGDASAQPPDAHDASSPDTGSPAPDAPDASSPPPDTAPPGCPTTPPVASAAMGSHFDPAVFDPAYYLCKNPDLGAAGITNAAAARLHWLHSGMSEGRVATPAFAVTEYLQRYSDLKTAFGTDYAAAVLHYVHYGLREGREGRLVATPNPAATVGQALRPQAAVTYGPSGRAANAIIELGSSARMAGGIDHLSWGGTEFINAYDHGRELQVAWSSDGFGECYNPTECGSSPDGTGPTSSSALRAAWVSGSLLGTEVQPGFWLAPGDAYCGHVHNTTVTSDYVLNKVVRVGYGGIEHVVEFLIQVTVPESLSSLTIEAPTGYLTGAFTSFFTIDVNAGVLSPLSAGPGEQGLPVILSDPGGTKAMGAWSPDLPQAAFPGAGYGRWAFPDPGNAANATNKWNIVFRRGATPPGIYDFHGFAIVGSLENVRVAMTQLRAKF